MYPLLLYDHWGLIYRKSWVLKSAENVVVFAIERKKFTAFQICIYFYCAVIGVSLIKNPGYTLRNPK